MAVTTGDLITGGQLRQALKVRAKKLGSRGELAKLLGISPQFLSDVINGKRRPGPRLLESLGLREFEGYEVLNVSRDNGK